MLLTEFGTIGVILSIISLFIEVFVVSKLSHQEPFSFLFIFLIIIIVAIMLVQVAIILVSFAGLGGDVVEGLILLFIEGLSYYIGYSYMINKYLHVIMSKFSH